MILSKTDSRTLRKTRGGHHQRCFKPRRTIAKCRFLLCSCSAFRIFPGNIIFFMKSIMNLCTNTQIMHGFLSSKPDCNIGFEELAKLPATPHFSLAGTNPSYSRRRHWPGVQMIAYGWTGVPLRIRAFWYLSFHD